MIRYTYKQRKWMIRYTYTQREWMIRYTYTQRTQKTLGHAAVRPRGHDSSICSPPTTFATLLQQKKTGARPLYCNTNRSRFAHVHERRARRRHTAMHTAMEVGPDLRACDDVITSWNGRAEPLGTRGRA